MNDTNKHNIDPRKQSINKVKAVGSYIAIGVFDVINTATPPGFELYLISEFSKVDNWNICYKLACEKILGEDYDQFPHDITMTERKYARGRAYSERTLGNMRKYYEYILELRKNNGGKRVGFI